jgi:hypothetical protein
VKNKNWRFLLANLLLGLLFTAYFVFCYTYLDKQKQKFNLIKDIFPSFYSRYSDMILGYSFMREEIINNKRPFDPTEAPDLSLFY